MGVGMAGSGKEISRRDVMKGGAASAVMAVGSLRGYAQTAKGKRQTEVSIRGEDFYINGKPTYAHRVWQAHRVEGLLMNARMVQGIFDDSNPETSTRWAYPDTHVWSADRNTKEFVAAMPAWRSHGLLAFTINLQGGSPEGYSHGGQPWINSAFAPDGSLLPAYMERLARILDEADRLGMVAIVGYFYQAQARLLIDEAAVMRAVDNATSWILNRGYRNVMVEINKESTRSYPHEILRPDRVDELITRVRHTERNGRRLMVSTSYPGPLPTENVVKAADFVLVHGNNVATPEKLTESIHATRAMVGDALKPILFNEDDHTGFDKADNNMVAAVKEHVSWGFFDYRRDGEKFEDGYQSPPVDWKIGSERKRSFFNLLSEITGEGAQVR
jgi:hypothetical protein